MSPNSNPNLNEIYDAELISRFDQFVQVSDRFRSNFSSWLQSSRALQEQPEVLETVTRVGNYVLELSDELIRNYENGTLTTQEGIPRIDEITLTINDITTTVTELQDQRNQTIYDENDPTEPLSGVPYLQFKGIQLVHDTFSMLKENIRISAPYDVFNLAPSFTITEITTLTQEGMVQEALDSSIISPALSAVGIDSIEDFNQIKNQQFTLSKIPAVIALVGLSIPEEVSQIADFVVDFLETTVILGIVQANRNEVLNSTEMEGIKEENQVLNLFALTASLPTYLSQLNLSPELITEIQALTSEIFAQMSQPSDLTVGELAEYISILIAIITTIMTVGTTLPARAATLSYRAARLAMGSSNPNTFRLWSRASRVLSALSSQTAILRSVPIPQSLVVIDNFLAGVPGAELLPTNLNRMASVFNTSAEATDSISNTPETTFVAPEPSEDSTEPIEPTDISGSTNSTNSN